MLSALPPKADIDRRLGNVRLVPKADISHTKAFRISISGTSYDDARARRLWLFDGGSDLNYAASKGYYGGMSPVESPELSSGSLDVLVDSSLGDMENFSDLPGGLAFCDQCQNFTFTRR